MTVSSEAAALKHYRYIKGWLRADFGDEIRYSSKTAREFWNFLHDQPTGSHKWETIYRKSKW